MTPLQLLRMKKKGGEANQEGYPFFFTAVTLPLTNCRGWETELLL